MLALSEGDFYAVKVLTQALRNMRIIEVVPTVMRPMGCALSSIPTTIDRPMSM